MTRPSVADAETLNRDLERAAPAVLASLSALGRRAFYPPGIPHQAAEARGTTFNGTIGQITDGHGHALPLPSMARLVNFDDNERDRAFLYSPVQGIETLRRAWRERQRQRMGHDLTGGDDTVPSTLPLAVDGLTHALSIVADLFAGPGRAVAIPGPFWGNYRQAFAVRTGCRIVTAPTLGEDLALDPEAIARALAGLPAGEPALAIVNAPSNPGGYMPTAAEREALVASLLEVAASRPLVALFDDAYAGLVYEDDIPRASLFWQLAGRHENLLALKVDGITKELSFFGGRVGFLTFGAARGSVVETVLESKVKSLVRSTVGSPVAISQAMVLAALRAGTLEAEVEAVRETLARRYRALRAALDAADPELLTPLPFNAGCFAVIRLAAGVDAETLRHHLIAEHDTGLVSIPPDHIRIAFCSVAEDQLGELVTRLQRGIAELRR